MSKVVLNYFPIQGRAEVVRVMLSYLNITYDERALPSPLFGQQAEWEKVRGEFEFLAVPVLEIDGHKLSETRSILRYLAAKHHLHPLDAYDLWRVDSLVDHYGDVEKAFFAVTLSKDEDAIKGFIEKTLVPTLLVLEARLKDNLTQDYLVGRALTVADVVYTNFVWSILTNEARDEAENQKMLAIVKNFPLMWAYLKKSRARFPRLLKRPPSEI